MNGIIGRYEIHDEIGRGGFGFVYRAYDPLMRRQVALKLLSSVADREMLQRFDAEAGVTGRLRHPNIVTVYDYGHHDGLPYLVLELLDGTDLKDLIASGSPLSLLERVRILAEVAAGLHYAHQEGVVHRDVKPANVMVLAGGGVKVMDFGIARLVSHAAERLTSSGLLMGTLPYMAPEQFAGHDADIQTDIFAYGVVCYELLTGGHPFRADHADNNIPLIMYRIGAEEPPPLRARVPELPPGIESIILRALAKPRDLRYPSLDELLLDLEPLYLELKRERAQALFAEVRPLMDSGAFDTAQPILKQILELDPSNREAQEMRRQTQQVVTRQQVRKRVDELVAEGSARLGRREFTEAIRVYEEASRLDTTDHRLRDLLEQAREAHQIHQRAVRVFAEAERAMAAGNYAEAADRAFEASRLDPGRAEYRTLAESARAALERDARIRALAAEVDSARRTGALERARVLAERMASEFPDQTLGPRLAADLAALTAFVANVQGHLAANRTDQAAALLDTAPASWQPELVALRAAVQARLPAPAPPPSQPAGPLPMPVPPRPRRRTAALFAGVALMSVAAAVPVVYWGTRSGPAQPPPAPARQEAAVAEAPASGTTRPPAVVSPPAREPAPAPAPPTPASTLPAARPKPALPARLALSGLPAGTRVLIDNAPVGVTSAEGRLEWSGAPGMHLVRVQADGYAAQIVPVTLAEGQTAAPKMALQRLALAAPVPTTGTQPAPPAPAAANAPAKPQPEPPAANLEAERQGVLATLQQFARAYTNRKFAVIQVLWPDMTPEQRQTIGNQLRTLRPLSLGVEPLEPVTVAGDSARVRCRITHTTTGPRGKEIVTPREAAVTMRKRNGNWRIETLNWTGGN